MIEAQVLAAGLHTRDVLPSLLTCSMNTKDAVTRIIMREAYEYLARDSQAARIDPDMLRSLCATKLAPNQLQRFDDLLSTARSLSAPNAIELDAHLRRNKWADDLLDALGRGVRDWDKIEALSLEMPRAKAELSPVTFDLLEQESSAGRLMTGIPVLDEHLGDGFGPGHTALVFARPEMGKSLFAINLARGFAEQGARGIYFENEEPEADTRARILCSIAGVTQSQLRLLGSKARERAQSVANNIYVHQLTPGTLGEIEALSSGYDWIVVNQLRNLSYKDSNRVVALEELAKGMRSIAARNRLVVVSVTQAGDSAEGKRVLGMGDVDFSNTGIPAAQDVMFGIGADKDLLESGHRCVSLPKNKRGGVQCNVLVKVDTRKSLIVT